MKSVFFLTAFLLSIFSASSAEAQSNNATVYMDNFKIIRSLGGGMSCDMYFHIFNDTEYDIDRVGVKLEWSGMRTRLSFSKVKKGEVGDKHYHLIGRGCETMGGQPMVEVSACRMRRIVNDEVQKLDEDSCKGMITFQ